MAKEIDLGKHKILDDEECQGLVALMDELTTKENSLKKELKEVERQIEQVQFHMKNKLETEKQDNITVAFGLLDGAIKIGWLLIRAHLKKNTLICMKNLKLTKKLKLLILDIGRKINERQFYKVKCVSTFAKSKG